MSIVAVQGNAAGTGLFTIAAPNSNNNQTLTLPDTSGEVGLNNTPLTLTTGTTASAAIRGGTYSTTGNILVSPGVFNAGDVFSIYNNTAGNLTVTQDTGLTMRLGGTSTTGSRTIAQRGLMTLLFLSTSEVVVGGSGVS